MSQTEALFDDLPKPAGAKAVVKKDHGQAPARVIMPNRMPVELRPMHLESTLAPTHRARLVWASRLVMSHDADRWISGGVPVNDPSLSEFWVLHAAVLDELLSTSVAALMSAGAVKRSRVGQDGMQVGATSAGAASFRRRGTLEECLVQAREHVPKADDSALLYALTHNLMRTVALAPQLRGLECLRRIRMAMSPATRFKAWSSA